MHETEDVTERAETARRSHYEQVYRYVRRRTRSREDAEDVTQTVFAEVLARLESSTAGSPPLLALLYTVARRRLIDERRRSDRSDARVIALDEARLDSRAPENYGIGVARAIAQGIATLTPEQQQVVVLKIIEGRRFAEIAADLSVSEEACRARLSRAMRTLRDRLEEEGMNP
jgi:RNA polymerase sigma factor (sigma-70 family)